MTSEFKSIENYLVFKFMRQIEKNKINKYFLKMFTEQLQKLRKNIKFEFWLPFKSNFLILTLVQLLGRALIMLLVLERRELVCKILLAEVGCVESLMAVENCIK